MSREKVDPSEDTGTSSVDPSEDPSPRVDPSEGPSSNLVDPSEGDVDPSEQPGGVRAGARAEGAGGGHGGGRPPEAGQGINPVQHSE